MSPSRRDLLRACSGVLAAGLLTPSALADIVTRAGIRAIAFDAFPIFDPGPVFALAEELFPGRGAELSEAWRSRQFEYTWLRTAAGRYADFWHVTEDALVFAAKMLRLDLAREKRDQLMQAYLRLRTWPDVLPALHALNEARLRLVLLSNLTPRMLGAAIESGRCRHF